MEDAKRSGILSPIADYYSSKLAAHGETPPGADWKDQSGQVLRFQQLSRLFGDASFSVNDVGCGYGAYLDYLAACYPEFSYAGWDISAEMIAAAQKRHSSLKNARFLRSSEPAEAADYSVASGIFNVRLQWSDAEWGREMVATLDALNETSRRGFAFNCLTSYSDPPKMRADLYYADPCRWFEHCQRNYSRDVALLHDYGLYEFTILVRKR